MLLFTFSLCDQMLRPILVALIGMFFAGITAMIAKLGMKHASGDVALEWINSLAFRQVPELKLLTKNDLLFLFLSGFTPFISWLFYYRAMKEGSVRIVFRYRQGE
jgi:transporter family protein